MNGSNKTRVFVALYQLQGITGLPGEPNHKFHWAFWLQEKNSQGPGQVYNVLKTDTYANVPGSGGWQYQSRASDSRTSLQLVARILIGKLPKDMPPERIDEVLSSVPLPQDDLGDDEPPESCKTWVHTGLRQLQLQGCVRRFDIDKFMNEALAMGSKCIDTSKWPGSVAVANYTDRPFEEPIDVPNGD